MPILNLFLFGFYGNSILWIFGDLFPACIPRLFPGVRCIIYTSRNHMKQKGTKSERPRFHVIFLIDPITDVDAYTVFVKKVQSEKLTSVLEEGGGKAAIVSAEGGIFDMLSGIYSKNVNMGDPLTMDEPHLTGQRNESGTDFIFISKLGGHICSQNSVLFVPIVAYIRCKYKRNGIARMSFTSPVINCIHPVAQYVMVG